MTTLKVILHPINKNKEGKRAIVLRATHIGIKYFINLGIDDKLFESQFKDGKIEAWQEYKITNRKMPILPGS